jgi:hypothetical protein
MTPFRSMKAEQMMTSSNLGPGGSGLGRSTDLKGAFDPKTLAAMTSFASVSLTRSAPRNFGSGAADTDGGEQAFPQPLNVVHHLKKK